MKQIILLCVCMALPLAACGHKGKLKTPAQIELEEQKKQAKAEKEVRKESEEQADKTTPALKVQPSEGTDLMESRPLNPTVTNVE